MKYMQQPVQNPNDSSDPTTAMNTTLALLAKSFKVNTIPTNNNQKGSLIPFNSHIAQSGMNTSQDIKMQMVDDNVGNQVRHNAVQNDRNEVGKNAVQNSSIQIVKNMNGLSVVLEITNQYGNRNVVTAPEEGNGNGNCINGNSIRCYNYRGEGHYASTCTVKPRKRDAAYLQIQLQIQKEQAGIQLNFEEFDFMAVVGAYDEIKEVNANCTLKDNLQQASTSCTQTNSAPVYDSDGSVEYTELLEPIPKPHQVQQNDSNVIFVVSSMEQGGGRVEQHSATVEETRAYHESFFHNLAAEVEKVNSVNRKLKETNNDWYKKCEECKYDKITYDKAYNDMQQKIEMLQAQLGDHKELEFQVWNCEKENAHLKTAYKNLFDSINVARTQTKTIINSLQTKLHDMIYENAKLRAQLFDNVFEQKDTTKESKVVENDKVIALGIFRINPFKDSRVDNFVRNKHVKASVRTKPNTVSQPHVITKNDLNSKTNGFSPKDVKSTTRTRRPLSRNNPKNDKVPSKSTNSWLSNNLEKIEENHRNLQSSSNQRHMSSKCNNIKLAIRNARSKVVCAMCKQCLINVNHDVCVLNYVNDMNSHALNKNTNVKNVENQKKHKPNVRKPKKVGSKERLASPKPSTPRSFLRWSPTGRIFELKGKIIATSKSVCQSDCSKGDNACTSNPQEPICK
nr:hypothetical protein [Tanacetum cinerariifolium]